LSDLRTMKMALCLRGWEQTIILGAPKSKKDVHIRLDPAVLRWFKAQGPGYQTRINTGVAGVCAGTPTERTEPRVDKIDWCWP
jgi:BrnA antitoxin of type II toxin-antitoxin system